MHGKLYLDTKIFSAYWHDGRDVAAAAAHEVDYLLTWNYERYYRGRSQTDSGSVDQTLRWN
jgi:hypothetical protein